MKNKIQWTVVVSFYEYCLPQFSGK